MLKKTIEYIDYNGNKRTEDFYFNLSKVELADLKLSSVGKFLEELDEIFAKKDQNPDCLVPYASEIVDTIKGLILKAYGEKSPDGKRFIKSQELRDAFSQTEAYSELFMELCTNGDSAVAFINGIIPSMPNAYYDPTLPDGSGC